jgi:UDP-3-O-[3-hydroxymyristoyl] glucosamine N-acyltransferase
MSIGDPRFFGRRGPHSLAAVAAAAGGTIEAGVEPTLSLTGVAPLQAAGPTELSWLDNKRYASLLTETRAGAVILHPDMRANLPPGCVGIVTREPYLGWAQAAGLFHPPPPAEAGIHPTALIAADARIDDTAEIGPFAVVGAGVEIGARCRIGPGAVIDAGVVIGPDCRIGAQASISHALIGARVVLFPGVRIGQEGFGFAVGAQGFVTVPQLGRVILEDDVQIGANSTVDRGSAQDTVIGAGSRLDNLVQIGHNVRLGRCCIIVAQVGISGSTVLEDFVTVGGQAGLAGHLTIGRKARIAAQSGLMRDVAAGVDVMGSPAQPIRDYFREITFLRKLAQPASARTRRRGTPSAAGPSPAEDTEPG